MKPKSSPEIIKDRLVDPRFVPCRDERCWREGLHEAHGKTFGRKNNVTAIQQRKTA
jgi:hypothetical protein